jgi:glycosyltransferase involved in cell wall biosynthesis
MLQLKEHLGATFWAGAVDLEGWDPSVCQDSFTQYLHQDDWKYLATESHTPVYKYIKRQLSFLLSPKVKDLAINNDVIIFSFGNIAFVPQRVKKYNPKVKTIAYVHTPPRNFSDQFDNIYNKLSWYKKPLFKVFAKIVNHQFKQALQSCDYIITNSENIKNRTIKYIGVEGNEVIFPLVDTQEFYNQPSQDFYLSHARLEPLKRLDLIVRAFARMPDKQLVITSGGPMEQWIKDYITENNIKNIDFKGRVSDQERNRLMATCLAGIYIPIDEDAGITQLEFMACGKPIIGVKDGGLIESVIDGQTGYLMSKAPDEEELITLINSLNPSQLTSMKQACITQAQLFDKQIFMNKFDKVISNCLAVK